MDPQLIFDLICRSFTTPPLVCTNEIKDLVYSKPQGEVLDKYKKNPDTKTNDNNWVSILILIFGVIIAFLLFVIIIKCKIFTRTELSKDITLNISSAVSRYFAFQDKNDNEKMIEVSA